MRVNKLLIPHKVLTACAILIATVTISLPVHAIKTTKNKPAKSYLLLQNTVWAANHRLTLTPSLMNLDAEHAGFVIQYSLPDQTVCAWNKARKEYAKEPLASWLKKFRNVAVILSWSSGLSKPNEIKTVNEWGRKAKQFVYEDINIARSYYSSDIGKRERTKAPATGYLTTIQLDGIDPKVGVVLARLYGYPESNEIPLEAYALRNKKKSHTSIHTIKLEENPKIEYPSVFVPPKDFKQIKDFQRIISPRDTDINAIF